MSEFAGVGDTMPDIAMETPDGGNVKPSDYKGQKLVVFFYPKDNTPGCTTEAKDFTALNFIAKHDLKTPLATDAEESGLSDVLGIWTEKKNYGRTYMGMVRTTYLIGTDGKIAQVWNKVRVKGHAEQVLEAAKAL